MLPVRVRFAPSPTGYLHIGGVRTALFNWLWAKKTGGTFVLRIEDTDRERSTPENEAIILRDMRWLGLNWDEGPEVGGPHGPYRQTERLQTYRVYADKLVAGGAAYWCRCTKETLDGQRAALKEKDPKAIYRYPGTCRDAGHAAPDGTTPTVLRMRPPATGNVTYQDLVFGEISTPNSAQQDAVLMRGDGVPLYNLGAVVDDITMGITLVARGRDHMVNTPVQILLYEALGAAVPAFAHLPMMLAPDGQKLSKRHGAVSVGEYRDQGIPPVGLLNYLVRFGWSHGDKEVFPMDELIQAFDWAGCSKSDGKFDAKKLSAIAFEHLKTEALTTTANYAASLAPYLGARGLSCDPATVERHLPSIRERAQTFVEAADQLDFFFRDPPVDDPKAVAKFLTKERKAHLEAVRQVTADAATFDTASLEARFHALSEQHGWPLKDLAQPARVALTGRTSSPGLFDVMVLLGKQRCLARLDRAIAHVASLAP